MTPPFGTDLTTFIPATGEVVFYLDHLNLTGYASESRATLAATLLIRRL